MKKWLNNLTGGQKTIVVVAGAIVTTSVIKTIASAVVFRKYVKTINDTIKDTIEMASELEKGKQIWGRYAFLFFAIYLGISNKINIGVW